VVVATPDGGCNPTAAQVAKVTPFVGGAQPPATKLLSEKGWPIWAARHFFQSTSQLEKLACGRFSDINSAAAGKRRGFCRLRRATVCAAQVRQAD
jgi:hypothetical protein